MVLGEASRLNVGVASLCTTGETARLVGVASFWWVGVVSLCMTGEIARLASI